MGAIAMSGVAQVLKRVGLLNELYSYSDIVSDPVAKVEVHFCSSEKCAGKNEVSKVIAKSHKNGMCSVCGHAVFVKMIKPEEYKRWWRD